MEIIQQYNPQVGNLTRSQQEKIKKILSHSCLERVEDNYWLCRPISGYNKNTYKIQRDFSWDRWKCNCQFFTTTGKDCAHISALKQYLQEWGEDGQRRLF